MLTFKKLTVAKPVASIVAGLTATLTALEKAQADNQSIIDEQQAIADQAVAEAAVAREERDTAGKIAENIKALLK